MFFKAYQEILKGHNTFAIHWSCTFVMAYAGTAACNVKYFVNAPCCTLYI